jgi:hypothetical protein
MRASVPIGRTALAVAFFVTGGLLWSASPAYAIGPTQTVVACAVQTPYAPNATYSCGALIGDADPRFDSDPGGTVAFFLDAISTPAFLGQCTTTAVGTLGGLSACGLVDVSIPPGAHTVWGIYYPAPGSPYDVSVGNDDVGNPAAGPPDPTDTVVLCVPTSVGGVAQPLACVGFVVDDDSDPGISPTGTVALFRNGINSPNFLGQDTLEFSSDGFSFFVVDTTPVPPGASTIWALYHGDVMYQASVGNDQVTV